MCGPFVTGEKAKSLKLSYTILTDYSLYTMLKKSTCSKSSSSSSLLSEGASSLLSVRFSLPCSFISLSLEEVGGLG